MDRATALVAARSAALLAVAAATTNRAVTGLALLALIRILERHWEKP